MFEINTPTLNFKPKDVDKQRKTQKGDDEIFHYDTKEAEKSPDNEIIHLKSVKLFFISICVLWKAFFTRFRSLVKKILLKNCWDDEKPKAWVKLKWVNLKATLGAIQIIRDTFWSLFWPSPHVTFLNILCFYK